MAYVGLHTQIRRNNQKSVALLIAFPVLLLLGVYVIIYFLTDPVYGDVNATFVGTVPLVLTGVAIWFVIAYFYHSKLIQTATHSKPLERRENKRVYNLVENLCIATGMKMPKLYIIETDALNAFASGVDDKSFALTLTRGIVEQLNDEELEGVIAHELSHIRNRDVRLLIVTIIFVGIFGFILDLTFRGLRFQTFFRNNKSKGGVGGAILIVLVVTAVLYFFSMVFKFALSRSREYMADAGAAEITRNPQALANALKKVAGHSELKTANPEVAELFLDNSPKEPQSFFAGISGIFASHPPIEKRIKILENIH